MPVTTDEQRTFVVRRLGLLESYTEIIAAYNKTFSATGRAALTNSDIESLDPSRGARLSEMLAAVFKANREYIVENFETAAPTSDKRIRLIELHNIYRLHRDSNRPGAAASVLAQIAIEQSDEATLASAAKGAKITAITRTIVDPVAPTAES